MNSVPSLLEIANSKKANEILIHASMPAQMRLGKNMLPLTGKHSDARILVNEVLNEDEKKKLFENLRVKGARTLGDVAFKFDFQIDFEGVSGSLQLQNSNAVQWQLPPLLIDGVLRGSGLHILCGPRRSGKTTAVQNLIQSLNNKDKVIAIYSDEEIPGLLTTGNIISQFSTDQLSGSGVLKSADMVVLDSSQTLLCEKALDLAEQGVCVVMTLPYVNLQMGLQRFLDLCSGSATSRARRLSQVLRTAMGTRLLAGLESPLQGAMEFMVVNASLQKNLQEWATSGENWTGFNSWMQNSMNQCLFQLLMKRKVEMKVAFDASPIPDELDSMLKKVGI